MTTRLAPGLYRSGDYTIEHVPTLDHELAATVDFVPCWRVTDDVRREVVGCFDTKRAAVDAIDC